MVRRHARQPLSHLHGAGCAVRNPYREVSYPGGAFQLSLALGWGASVGGLNVDPARLTEALRLPQLNP